MVALVCGLGVREFIRDVGPMLALLGVAITLLVNGAREERQRRREIHARALEAVAAYFEMPFLIRRRRDDEPAAERVRLAGRFADVQAELASCEALIRADRDPVVRDAYSELVQTLRTTAGEQSAQAWETPAITSDKQMRMKDLMQALQPIEQPRAACERAMADSARLWRSPRRRKQATAAASPPPVEPPAPASA